MDLITVKRQPSGRPVRPLNGVNGGPVTHDFRYDAKKLFADAHIPYCRLHDIEGALGGGKFVDVRNIFPIWELDENDPKSYDFTFTDEYLKQIDACGAQSFYRLGQTIDHGYFKAHVRPPADAAKWARICANIVRHYNEGWADGFHYGIKYWEIWNEPENPPMWTGTQAEYFELYRVTANLLRREFPDIRIGGYASCGVYAAFDENADDFYRSFITWFDDFLAYVKAPETASPLDFFSWHIYSSDPSQVLAHARYCREKLDKAGFEKTEAILDEWNWAGKDMFERMRDMTGASFTADVMCRLQKTDDVDVACYYDAQPDQAYGGLFLRHTDTPSRAYYAVKAFGKLYALGGEADYIADTDLAAAAATDGNTAAAVVSNYEKESRLVTLCFPGAKRIRLYLLDGSHDLSPIADAPCDTLTTTADKNTVLYAEADGYEAIRNG
ncbi:MAG: hypothetical protein IJL26_12620 [Clostridia bacterium]|nr:hypothetical protein [Clostridia bacterium]